MFLLEIINQNTSHSNLKLMSPSSPPPTPTLLLPLLQLTGHCSFPQPICLLTAAILKSFLIPLQPELMIRSLWRIIIEWLILEPRQQTCLRCLFTSRLTNRWMAGHTASVSICLFFFLCVSKFSRTLEGPRQPWTLTNHRDQRVKHFDFSSFS